MRQVVISYVEPDTPWADWLAWEVSGRGIEVSLERADLTSWGGGEGVVPGSAVLYVPLMSDCYLTRATTAARWWSVEDGAGGADRVTPVVVGQCSSGPAGLFDLTDEPDAAAASDALANHLDLGSSGDRETMWTAAFGDGSPAYPNAVPPVWRMWPRRPRSAINPSVLSALFHALGSDSSRSRCVSITARPGSGKSASITEYAVLAASDYAACWAIECADLRLLQMEVDRLAAGPGAATLPGPRLLVLGGVDQISGELRLPNGTWHVVGLGEATQGPDGLRLVVSGAPDTGWQDLGDVAAAEIEPAPVLDDLPDAAVSLARVLSACARYAVPRSMLRHGAVGAPEGLAERLDSSTETAGLLRRLAAAGLIHMTPRSVRLRSSAQQLIGREAPDHTGFAANIASSAAIRYGALDMPIDEWAPLLIHLGATVARSRKAREPRRDLCGYLAGWERGDLQVATALSGVSAAGAVLGTTRYGACVADLIAQVGEHTDAEVSIQTRLYALLAEARAVRGAGDPQAALRILAAAQDTALAPEESLAQNDDRGLAVLPVEIFIERAQSSADLGDAPAGVAALEEMWRLSLAGVVTALADYGPIHRLHADLLIQSDRFDDALEIIESHVLDCDPVDADDSVGLDLLAFCLLRAGRPEAAAAHAERALSLDCDRPVVERTVLRPLLVRAEALRRLGRLDEALDSTRHARRELAGTGQLALLVDACRIEAEVWIGRGEVDRCLQRLDEAAGLAREAGAVIVECQCRYRAGLVLVDAGRSGEAHDVLGRAPDPSETGGAGGLAAAADLVILRARIDLRKHRLDRALDSAERATLWVDRLARVDARFVDAYFVHCHVLNQLGRFDDAVALGRRADSATNELDGARRRDLALRLVLARALRGAGRPTEALLTLISVADSGTQLADPTLPVQAQLERGRLMVETGARIEGLAVVVESIGASFAAEPSADPADWSGFRRTVVHALLDLDEAEVAHPLVLRTLHDAYRDSGPLSPEVATGLDNLSRVRVALASADTAILPSRMAVQTSRAVEERPTLQAVRSFNLADALIAAGRPTEAVHVLQAVISIDEAAYGAHHPEVGADYRLLSIALQRADLLPEAVAARRKADEILAGGGDAGRHTT